MGFFAGSVDLTSPGPIGSTTPNTGAFTTLSFAPASNTSGLTSTSYSLTGSNAQSLVSLSGTWNTTGTPTAIILNLTDTASNASSRLLDLQIGGSSRFSVSKTGEIVAASTIRSGSWVFAISEVYAGGAFGSSQFYAGSAGINLGSATFVAWTSGNSLGTKDTYLYRDAANILAQRNSTNAQAFRLYNTFTDASNYERGFFRWNTNVLEIGAEAAGTGTQRQLRLPLGTVTASTPLSVTQTWNSAGVTFTGIQANITDTASASGSYLMDLQVGGATKFRIGKGSIHYIGGNFVNGGTALECYFSEAAALSRTVSSRVVFFGQESSVGMAMSAGYGISWSSNSAGSGDCFASRDLFLLRDGSGVLGQRNGANAQTFRLYRTFTDASNYERLGFLTTNTTRYTITSQNAGTGSARSLEFSFYTSASDPTSTDITDGCFSVWKNSGTGTIKLWANDGGTMKSVALA